MFKSKKCREYETNRKRMKEKDNKIERKTLRMRGRQRSERDKGTVTERDIVTKRERKDLKK